MVGDTIRAVKDAEAKADKLLKDAQEKGDALVEEAKKEAARMEEEAAKAGKQAAADMEEKSQREGDAYLEMAMEGAKSDIAALRTLASGKESEAVELIISQLV